MLDEVKTRFKPNISRESSNAAPTIRDNLISEYTCALFSEQHIFIILNSLQFKIDLKISKFGMFQNVSSFPPNINSLSSNGALPVWNMKILNRHEHALAA